MLVVHYFYKRKIFSFSFSLASWLLARSSTASPAASQRDPFPLPPARSHHGPAAVADPPGHARVPMLPPAPLSLTCGARLPAGPTLQGHPRHRAGPELQVRFHRRAAPCTRTKFCLGPHTYKTDAPAAAAPLRNPNLPLARSPYP